MIDPDALARPPRLAPGDRLAIVSLSWGGPGAFPHRYEAGVRQLRDAFGVEVVPMPNALRDPAWVAANPRARADDLLSAFADPTIAGIVSTIGGDDSIRLLPFLDLSVIAANPKVVLGFSDTTITHMACLRAGLGAFYGPSIMTGFAENGGLLPYMADGVRRMLFEPESRLPWPENTDGWTVEHVDWEDVASQDRARTLTPSTGWRWHGGSPAEGPIVAACLEVMDWLRGTPWWPDLDGAVLAVETTEDQPSPEAVASFLRALAATGDLGRLRAVLFARPGGSDLPPADHVRYDDEILRVVREEEGLDGLPVVTGMDFGHTDPVWTIPIGVPVRVDPAQRAVTFLRAGVV
jgi:muramoyltetrapeptide carboxypeptidase LdcA involved in peptidoglycan recycling